MLAPWPRRSSATIRNRVANRAATSSQVAACSPRAWSSTIAGESGAPDSWQLITSPSASGTSRTSTQPTVRPPRSQRSRTGLHPLGDAPAVLAGRSATDTATGWRQRDLNPDPPSPSPTRGSREPGRCRALVHMLTIVTSWRDFAADAPSLATTVRRTFAIRKHATMASIRRDGSPRISGTEVDFAGDGEIYLEMMPGAKRAGDLRRDSRLALHCPTEDTPVEDPASWLGDGKITGHAIEVEPHRFRIDIETVVLTRVAPGGGELEITTWCSDGHQATVRRS